MGHLNRIVQTFLPARAHGLSWYRPRQEPIDDEFDQLDVQDELGVGWAILLQCNPVCAPTPYPALWRPMSTTLC